MFLPSHPTQHGRPGTHTTAEINAARTTQKLNALTPEQIQQCSALALRAVAMVKRYRILQPKDNALEENPEVARLDYAVVLLTRRYDLLAAFRADDIDFFRDAAMIQKNIVRATLFFPQQVPLKFARIGTRL
jgi:hypothetical protein